MGQATSDPPGPAPGYGALLRLPGVGVPFVYATIGRFSFGPLPLAVLLAVESATGSYGDAGLGLAAFGLGALNAPVKARILDRLGTGRTLPVIAATYAVSILFLAGACMTGMPTTALVSAAAVAGFCSPPLGPVMRALWSQVTDGTRRRRAFSLDSAVEETIFALGPAVGAGVVAVASAPFLLAGLGGLALIGSLGLASRAHPRTSGRPAQVEAEPRDEPPEPGVQPDTAGPSDSAVTSGSAAPADPAARADSAEPSDTAVPADPAAGPDAVRSAATDGSTRPPPRLTSTGFLTVLGSILGIGTALGILDVAIAARAGEEGAPAAAGVLFTALAAGSVAGGLIWGRLRPTARRSTEVMLLAIALAVMTALLGLAGNLVVVAVILMIGGLAASPAFVVANTAADDLAPDNRKTEALTWVNTSNNVGAVAGSALAGVLLDVRSLESTFVAATAILLVTAMAVRAVAGRADPQLTVP